MGQLEGRFMTCEVQSIVSMNHGTKLRHRLAALLGGAALSVMMGTPASAQTAPAPSDNDSEQAQVTEIIVTAQKRQESANTVPMSITAVSASDLATVGVSQPRDLVKVSTSFNYTDSYVGSPIYTLRGVGFSDISLGGRPTVSIYVDEAPIPFAIETRGASLDLERVEVLKGPQGTLFGQNATGGAINYIAAKPTKSFAAGFDATYGRFNAWELNGFVSGPLSDTLSARIAVDHTGMDGWQRSYTSGARNGRGNFTNGRLSLAWEPSSSFKGSLTVSAFTDRSDVQAGQAIEIAPTIPAAAGFIPGLLTYPLAPANARAADFTTGLNYGRDNNYFQANLRLETKLSDSLTLISLTSYSRFRERQLQDIDGTALQNISQDTDGRIDSFSQEIRLAADVGTKGHLVIGADYSHDIALENGLVSIPQSTVAFTFVPFGLPLFTSFRDYNNQRSDNVAAFASGDFALTDTLRASAGVRYTRNIINYNGCSADSGDGIAALNFGSVFNLFRAGALLPPNPAIAPGGCYSATAAFVPGLATNRLSESNVSWRAGLDWKPAAGVLVYANVSKGYKAGSFPTIGATLQSQLSPAVQESVVAYEAGFKATLADRTVQLIGAVFHYDYSNKQILGKIADPVFGRLLKLINVPKSKIDGAEIDFAWTPVRGLKIGLGGSYINSRILDHFTNYNPLGVLIDFDGEAFPNTPKWQFIGNVDYKWPISSSIDASLGAGVTSQSSTNSQLGNLPILFVKGYTVVDVRAAIESHDNRWKFSVWGRNVGNAYYWTSSNSDLDTTVRFAAMPVTYGATLSLRFN